MTYAEIFRLAAKNISERRGQPFSCLQICCIANSSVFPPERLFYEELMNDSKDTYEMVKQFDNRARPGEAVPQKVVDLRVLALLFAAEVAEDEGL